MKHCRKCKVQLDPGVNCTENQFNRGNYICRKCKLIESYAYKKANPDKVAKHFKKAYDTKYKPAGYFKYKYEHNKDGYYYVYHIADGNYVGCTGNLKWRMRLHKSHVKQGLQEHAQDLNKGTGIQILYKTSSRREALDVEYKLHKLGFKGSQGERFW